MRSGDGKDPLRERLSERRISALIFDLDGVLIDSTAGVVDATNYALKAIGKAPRSAQEVRRFIGSPLPVMFEEFAPGIDFEEIIRPHFRKRALEVITVSSSLLPGATETLHQMRKAGFLLGIGSTKIRPHIQGIVDKFNWGELVSSFSGADEAPPKPAPDIFLKTAGRLGKEPEEVLIIGDTANDTIAARAAGMSVVTIESDLGDRETLNNNPAERHFANLYEFTEYICGALEV